MIGRRCFAAALDGALAATAGGCGGGRTEDEYVWDEGGKSARPTWLTHPTDAAGKRRPAGAYRPELFNAAAAAAAVGGGGVVFTSSGVGGGASFDPATLRIPPDELKAMPQFTRQFWGIKSRLMDCVVMCRHGSFYNLFDVDSEVGMGVGLRISGKPAAFMQKVGGVVTSIHPSIHSHLPPHFLKPPPPSPPSTSRTCNTYSVDSVKPP